MKHYRDMTEAEAAEWGRQELANRKADLQDRTPAGLKAAQKNAKRRANAVSMPMSVATSLVIDATRESRRNEQLADTGILDGSNRTTSGGIGQP